MERKALKSIVGRFELRFVFQSPRQQKRSRIFFGTNGDEVSGGIVYVVDWNADRTGLCGGDTKPQIKRWDKHFDSNRQMMTFR